MLFLCLIISVLSNDYTLVWKTPDFGVENSGLFHVKVQTFPCKSPDYSK